MLGVVEDILVICRQLRVSDCVQASPEIRTRLGDSGLALLQGWLDLQLIAELHAIGLAASLQYDGLKLAGEMVQGVDRGLEDLRVDDSQSIKVWLFNVRSEDDVRDGLDVGNLGFQRRDDIVDGARQINAGGLRKNWSEKPSRPWRRTHKLNTRVSWKIRFLQRQGSIRKAGDFGEGGL